MPAYAPTVVLMLLMPEKLFDGFEFARVGIEHDLRAQVPKLVRREHDTGASSQISHDQTRHRRLILWRAVDIHEQPCGTMTDDLRREAIAILDQHLGDSEAEYRTQAPSGFSPRGLAIPKLRSRARLHA